jgi:hypothetical protein
MAKVQTMSGIASISGRLGNYCFRTMKATGKVYMHPVASKKQRPATAPSAAMVAQRERFAAIVKMVHQMMESGSKKSRKQLWKIAAEAYDASRE